MKILFLHGLESNNKSSKVKCMLELGQEVLAPALNYFDNKNLYQETLDKLMKFEPDIIVGSSMGGYFAYHLGTHYETNLLLLNPALPNRSFDPPILSDGTEKSKVWTLIGKNDDVVDPISNEKILKSAGAVITIGDHAHRTPVEVFEPFFKSVLKQI
jgi:uncharacterized protein